MVQSFNLNFLHKYFLYLLTIIFGKIPECLGMFTIIRSCRIKLLKVSDRVLSGQNKIMQKTRKKLQLLFLAWLQDCTIYYLIYSFKRLQKRKNTFHIFDNLVQRLSMASNKIGESIKFRNCFQLENENFEVSLID